MTPDEILTAIRDIIQEDVGGRGLRTDPADNLITACAGDFAAACRSIAETPRAAIAVVTGFIIPTAEPPTGETDGPLGAVFLARALAPIGIPVVLLSDPFALPALRAGLAACRMRDMVPVAEIPQQVSATRMMRDLPVTHLIALERVGPSHTLESVRPEEAEQFNCEVLAEQHDRCHTMRGRDVTDLMRPAHRLFERGAASPVTIGIGDGGNEIGMGKIPWATIRRNVPDGGLTACRVATDHLIVCGVSNWGAYALAAGVRLLRGASHDPSLFDGERERDILRIMVEQGPLVDGKTGERTVSVDGLAFERYAGPLRRIGEGMANDIGGPES
ncbi:MAG: glutamate cyclase domain-containing protein [Pseudonocardiaceae bacterium]